jgi:hypothetical protein
VIQRRDEHRRHAVQRGGALLLHGIEHRARLEPGAGIDHRRAVRQAAQVPEDHPEAVVERDGDHQSIPLGEVQQLRGEEAVVEDVVVTERGALGKPGGAARELDVDRVVELLLSLPPCQFLRVNSVAQGEECVPFGHAGRRLLAEPDDAPQGGERGGRRGAE